MLDISKPNFHGTFFFQTAKSDVEAAPSLDAAHFVVLRARARRVSTTTTLCLLLTALTVVSIGIVGGTYLYRHYAVSMQVHHLWCRIPYKKENTLFPPQLSDSNTQAMISDHRRREIPETNLLANLPNDYFLERFELDVDQNEYEKIDVPDFNDGRRGRFIHDFNSNITGIIDIDNKRCFVMPLNRQLVLPPRSLFDLIHKIWDGYYKVNTEVVRETMRVVTPPLEDKQMVGTYIARECQSLPIYRLEKYRSPGKNSVDSIKKTNTSH